MTIGLLRFSACVARAVPARCHAISTLSVSRVVVARAARSSWSPAASASFHTARTARASCSSPPQTPAAAFDLDSAMAKLGSTFADARMDIEDALESVGSVYYPSDIQQAIDSVNDTLQQFDAIQTQLGSTSVQATKMRESWGLRLEQLKQELQQGIDAGGADH